MVTESKLEIEKTEGKWRVWIGKNEGKWRVQCPDGPSEVEEPHFFFFRIIVSMQQKDTNFW